MLLFQTFARLHAADLGFRTDVRVGGFSPPAAPCDSPAKYRALYDQVLERASAISGVRRAALTSVLPLRPGDSDMDFAIEGRPRPTAAAEETVTWYREVSAGFALLLAAVGIYGVMAYVVSQRTTEIGVRMALGATTAGVFRLVVGDGLRLALLGLVSGMLAAIVVARWRRTLLFGIEPTDPATLAFTAAVLLGVAGAASVIPAWRASRLDPMVALRRG